MDGLDKENDVILDYSDENLLDVLEEISNEEKEIKDYYKYLKAYNKFKSDKKLKDQDLLRLNDYDFEDPFNSKDFKMPKPKYLQYRINF